MQPGEQHRLLHPLRCPCPAPRYTTLLGALELWRSVQADGPGRLAGDDTLPPGGGLVGSREEDLSEQIKADPEDRLSAAFVGFDDDGPVFRLPFTGRMGERKGHSQHLWTPPSWQGETSGLSWRVVGCCHLSGLRCGSEPPRACMGVRGPGPNHSRVLAVRCCTLVIPIPSRRPLRHAVLPLAPRPRGPGALTRPGLEPDKRPP